MRVLITGAFGFVGSNLSAYLAGKGIETWALDIQETFGNRQSAIDDGRGAYTRRFDWGQLREIPWCAVDAVVHLAGKAHDTRNASGPQSYFDVNVGLTKKVFEVWRNECSRRGEDTPENEGGEHPSIPVKKFILFSSVKAVADRVAGVLTEDVLPEPKTPYGHSKLEAEREVLKFKRSQVRESREAIGHGQSATGKGEEVREAANNENRAHGEDFRTYILRPCMIHGPGNKGNLSLLFGMVRRGVPWPLGAFENRRSFASIGNVCAVVECLLMGDGASGVYQVADDEALSTNELIGLISESMGRRAKIWRVPSRLVRAAARIGDLLHLPLNSERLKKLTESYVVSNEKIKKILGWEKMPKCSREGMIKTLESMVANLEREKL